MTESESDRLSAFFGRNSYISGNYTAESAFSELNAHIMSLPGAAAANRLFYLALPPTIYHSVTKNIKQCCMSAKSVDGPLSPMKYTVHSGCCFLVFIWLDMWCFGKCKPLTLNLSVEQRLEQGDCRKAIWA